MKLVKCPRCDLNYIKEDEKYCKVCLRELKGDAPHEEVELCSVCNENPVLPGRDVCLFCLKEMNGDNERREDVPEVEPETMDAADVGNMEDMSEMDEITPDIEEEISSSEYGEIENELSLETVREDEESLADDEDESEDN